MEVSDRILLGNGWYRLWGLAFWLPANPAFSLIFCPHPPIPLPGGKGETKVISCKGLRPLHPRGWVGRGTGFACGKRGVAGGLPFWLPAAPPLAYFAAPPSPKGKDIPPTRARRALFPAGRGRLRLFQARGFAPCIPGGWMGQGASYSCRSDTQGTLRQEDRARTIGLSQYSIFGKSSGGSGGLFQESPSVLPSVLPVVSPVPSAKAVRRERVRERPSRCMTV